ncbi:MAG: hypothetical protein V4727_12975 [Verrucomicrobiota bacterium]
MADREDLEKLFDAALHEREAPTRFGTPAELRKTAPAVFEKAEPVFQKADEPKPFTASPFKADTSEAKPFAPFVASPFQAAPPVDAAGPEVVLDEKALASLDENINAEFEELTNKKIAKERAKRRRDRVVFYVLLIGAVAGAGGWLVTHPDQMEMVKKTLGEIRLAIDPTAVAGKYDKSLEKVGERGDQLGEASNMLGGTEVEGEDPGLDKEMKEIAGEGAGLSPSEKQKKLKEMREKLGKKEKSAE